MTTSVHISPVLLEAVDRRARALRISGNRLIVKALERELAEGEEWSVGFFEWLRAIDPAEASTVDDMLAAVRARRPSREPMLL